MRVGEKFEDMDSAATVGYVPGVSDLKIESPFPVARHRDSSTRQEYVYLDVPAAKG